MGIRMWWAGDAVVLGPVYEDAGRGGETDGTAGVVGDLELEFGF